MSGISYTPAIVPLGGTGDGTLDPHGVVLGQGNIPVKVTSGSSTGQVLTWVSTSADPTFQTPTVGGLVLLTSGTATAVATLDIVLTTYTAYRGLLFVLSGFIPATDGDAFWVRFSTDGGVSYIASGYNYTFGLSADNSGAWSSVNSGSDTKIAATGANVGNGTTEGLNGRFEIFGQTSAALWSRIYGMGYLIDNSATPRGIAFNGGGAQEAAQDTDAVQFLFSTGNIASGDYAVYGYS